MIVVHVLNERLDLASLGNSGLTHVSGNLKGSSLDTGNKGVGELLLVGSLIEVLHNNALLSGLSSGGDNADSAWLHAKERLETEFQTESTICTR